MVKKRRKVVNGIEIVLFEKSVTKQESPSYDEVEQKLTWYIDSQLSSKITPTIQTTIEKEIQSVTEKQIESLFSYTFTKDEFLGIVENDPEDGSIVSYDSVNKKVVWKQSPNVRSDLIENKLAQYPYEFRSDFIASNRFYMPFAVVSPVTGEIWGGKGKGGIFWGDPWLDPMDNFSIKFGKDDASIGETGYSYGYVSKLAMKFSNGTEENGRGFVWTSVGPNGSVPVMSLDTMDPTTLGGGNLTVKRHIVSQYGNVTANETLFGKIVNVGITSVTFPYDAPIVVQDSFVSSGQNIIKLNTDALTSPSLDGYVMTYRHLVGPVGVIGLEPPTGGSGGTSSMYSTSGGVINCGSFLSTDGMINCGSFI